MRVEIIDGKPFKRGRGRVDYLLRAFVGGHEQPLTLAFVDGKKEWLQPTHGLEQVKAYARRYAVNFVHSTNGHLFIEYDAHTGNTSEARPMAQFPSPERLRERWFAATGLHAQSPALAPLLTAYHASGDRPRYYQDAAIRAVLERAALAAAGKERPRAALADHGRRQDQHRRRFAAAPAGSCGVACSWSIYMPTIQSFHINAPAIAEQRRIARKLRDPLAAAETLQARLAERRTQIERLPQRILTAAFGEAD